MFGFCCGQCSRSPESTPTPDSGVRFRSVNTETIWLPFPFRLENGFPHTFDWEARNRNSKESEKVESGIHWLVGNSVDSINTINIALKKNLDLKVQIFKFKNKF